MKNKKNTTLVFTALFAAIISVTGFIAIPIGAVPIVLQNMMPILAGSLLGGIYGGIATCIFLIAGALGLPVFSGGSGGFAHIMGPTGGFLIGYLLGCIATGFILQKPSISTKTATVKISLACLAGFIIMYIPGIFWFMHVTSSDLAKTFMLCVLPYLPGDAIKLVTAILLAIKLRPVVARYISQEK